MNWCWRKKYQKIVLCISPALTPRTRQTHHNNGEVHITGTPPPPGGCAWPYKCGSRWGVDLYQVAFGEGWSSQQFLRLPLTCHTLWKGSGDSASETGSSCFLRPSFLPPTSPGSKWSPTHHLLAAVAKVRGVLVHWGGNREFLNVTTNSGSTIQHLCVILRCSRDKTFNLLCSETWKKHIRPLISETKI